jgi:DNA (cytosine-5)-methyltransferase 1
VHDFTVRWSVHACRVPQSVPALQLQIPGITTATSSGRLRGAGLFAGIGGIECGLHASQHETILLCEIDAAANRVLAERFPGVPLHDDVTTLPELPKSDVVVAGFPCQDLSQAGRTAGITGRQSGLVEHVFRLLDHSAHEARWLVLENVPFMLQLERGEAMNYLVSELGRRDYRWAYRVVDTRSFGIPQRRQRVVLVASRTADPRGVLFPEKVAAVELRLEPDSLCGFYWTEGLRGLGWAVDAVPTLKAGSAVGIPSPPGIWVRVTGEVGTPDIRDAERLQGFPADWTAPAVDYPQRRNGPRWKLVGNAVSVPLAKWLGRRLLTNETWNGQSVERRGRGSWPVAAWGEGDRAYLVESSTWPCALPYQRLGDFLHHELTPLSHRAAAGFYARTRRSTLRFHHEFLAAIEAHVMATAPSSDAAQRRAAA